MLFHPRSVVVAFVAALAVTAPAAPADAATAPADAATAGGAHLRLTVRGAGTRVAVVLRCDPTAGNHPKADEACTAIAAAGGDISAVQPRVGIMCTAQYQPVTATARGFWHGRPVRYRHTFSNACHMHTTTAVVFDF
jgi:Subtilisin inhibitor-like